MKDILMIEDDPELGTLVRDFLCRAGMSVDLYESAESGLSALDSETYRLILLDVMLPKKDGYSFCTELRKSYDTPVLMMSARDDDQSKLTGYGTGADDYITKPYNPTILLLRISAVLKRSAAAVSVQTYNGLQVNDAKGSLSDGSREMTLTKNEMIIFRFMLDRKGSIVTRDELMTALWDNDEFVNDNALTVNISRLRSKLAELGCEDAIETRKKQGYILR